MMKSTTTSVSNAIKTGNYAFPYGVQISGKVVPFERDINSILELIGPAGSISSSAVDMTNWLQFHLNKGMFNNKQVITYANLKTAYAPTTAMQNYFSWPRPILPAAMDQASYGMGWWIGSYRGHPYYYHGGNTIGHSALVIIFPLDNIAISILTNMDGIQLPHLLTMAYVMDLLLGYTPWLNATNTCNFPCSFVKCSETSQKKEESPLNHPLKSAEYVKRDDADYAGTYSHPSFGNIIISESLNVTFNNMQGTLLELSKADFFYFRVDKCPLFLNPSAFIIQFTRSFPAGSIDSLLILLEAALPPIVFTNVNYVPKSCGFPIYP